MNVPMCGAASSFSQLVARPTISRLRSTAACRIRRGRLRRTRRNWNASGVPKQPFATAALVLLSALTVAAAELGPGHAHSHRGPKAAPARPSGRVHTNRVDAEIENRKHANPLQTSRVIVTL